MVLLEPDFLSRLMNGTPSDLDMARGLKALFFKYLNIAAEAATHKGDLWDLFYLI